MCFISLLHGTVILNYSFLCCCFVICVYGIRCSVNCGYETNSVSKTFAKCSQTRSERKQKNLTKLLEYFQLYCVNGHINGIGFISRSVIYCIFVLSFKLNLYHDVTETRDRDRVMKICLFKSILFRKKMQLQSSGKGEKIILNWIHKPMGRRSPIFDFWLKMNDDGPMQWFIYYYYYRSVECLLIVDWFCCVAILAVRSKFYVVYYPTPVEFSFFECLERWMCWH